MTAPDYYVGTISGTSMDGIDCALIDFNATEPVLVDTHFTPMPQPLRKRLLELCHGANTSLPELGSLDIEVGRCIAESINQLLAKASVVPSRVTAIGSHGQTVYHQPEGEFPFTLQIGDPNTISSATGIDTVADFRRMDMAAGGQGAPLAPLFHKARFAHQTRNRAVLNLGGIANLTLLPAGSQAPVSGFDTGPANVLMDIWINEHKGVNYDADGAWAASGKFDQALLDRCLADGWFSLQPPKSTGRELFNPQWLHQQLKPFQHLAPEDVQRTLLEVSARSVADTLMQVMSDCDELLLCGGGARNTALVQRLDQLTGAVKVSGSDEHGVPADWMEAMCFAWLAKQNVESRAVDCTRLTGARRPCVLGGRYFAGRQSD